MINPKGAVEPSAPLHSQPPLPIMTAPTIKDFFKHLPGKFDAEAADDLEAVYQFDLSGPQGGQYVITIRKGACQVREGRDDDPHVTLSMASEDCPPCGPLKSN